MVATSAAWREAVVSRDRTFGYRVEAVTSSGQVLGPVSIDAATVGQDGSKTMSWSADFASTDPALVPRADADILSGLSRIRLRVWWRLLTDAGWEEHPVGTYVVERPTVRDDGLLRIAVPGLDVLELVARGGYGPHVVQVGSATASAALALLFETAAPGIPVSIEPSTVTMPPAAELWDRSPDRDWTDIARMAGQEVRTNRWGVVTVARPVESDVAVADWQEGEECVVTEIESTLDPSRVPRRVIVASSSPDVDPLVYGVWDNPDAAVQGLTLEVRIESPVATTVEACEAHARREGEATARPLQYVEVTVPQRGDLSVGDLVYLRRARAGVSGEYRIEAWSMTLRGPDQPPAPMTVRMAPRAWLP